MPDAMKAAFEANDSGLAAAEQKIELINSAMRQSPRKFDADLERYGELVKEPPKLPCQLEDNRTCRSPCGPQYSIVASDRTRRGRGHHLHPDGARFGLPGGDRGSVLAKVLVYRSATG